MNRITIHSAVSVFAFALLAIGVFAIYLPTKATACTCALSVDKTTITEGDSVRLSWNFSEPDEFSIDNGIGKITKDGGVTLHPTVTTTYTGTVKSPSGKVVNCAVTVVVKPKPLPPKCTLHADDTSINVGDSVKLTWTSTNANSASFNNGIGSVALDGSKTVSPTETTTYVGTFRSKDGKEVTCEQKIVVVTPPPCNCTITATKKTIVAGESTTISWTSDNAVSAVIDNGVGSVSVDGSKTLSPTVTTTYTITFTDKYGKKKTCVITIVVTQPQVPPTCTIGADRTTIVRGESTKITWTSAHTLTAKGPFGDPIELSDSWTTSPTETTTYTFTFFGANNKKVECAVKIVVTTPPPSDPICTLDADPVSLPVGGGRVHLVWTSTNAVSASFDNGIGDVSVDGSKDVNVTEDTTFKGTFKNAAGKKVYCSKKVTVQVPPHTPQCTLSISPDSVVQGSGTSVTLTWSGTNVTSGYIDHGIATVTPSGSTTFIPNQETLYTGTFTGPYGNAVCSARVTVTVPQCTTNCGGGGYDQPRVEISKRDLPNNSPLAFVYLSQVPYTGFPATPLQTALYWLALVVISGVIAYYIVIKNVLWKFAAVVFGARSSMAQPEALPSFEEQMDQIQGDTKAAPAQNSYSEIRTSAAPMNLPGGMMIDSGNATPAPVFREPASSLKDTIESRSHAEQILLSPEVVETIIAEGSGRDTEVMSILESVVAGAKASYPREDGWILVNRDRLRTLVPAITPKVVRDTPVAGTNAHHVAEITKEFAAAVEVKGAPVVTAPAPEPAKVSFVASAMPKELTAANFMTALAEGKEEDAYKMLRTLTAQGKTHEFMLSVISSLDALYMNRIEGGKSVDQKIAEKTAVFSNGELEQLLAIMIGGVDYTYSSDSTASKLAVAKAIEFFKSKNK